MHSTNTSNQTSFYLTLLSLSVLVALAGCQGDDGGNSAVGGNSAGTAGQGGIANGTSGGGGATTTGGTADGASMAGRGGNTAGGGTSGGGNPMSARSCDKDCPALASPECARFTIATCVAQCQKAAQDGIDGAKAVGCLDQYLALDQCRVNDPVCTHPNPNECVPEDAAYIQCLQNAAQ